MNRYDFEILKYIENKKYIEYSIRNIADNIAISSNTVKEHLDTLISEGLIINKDNILNINELGLKELEPYRVNKAFILAAGFGSRMMPATSDRPKPLVKVNGKCIIETLIESLIKADIKDITIVRGYKKEKFDELLIKYPYIKLVDNDIYDKANNISSLMCILDDFDRSYLCEADLYISNLNIISKYQYTSNILGSYALETDDWSFKLDKDGYISDYQKGNTYCFNYYGISFWTHEDCEKLKNDYKEIYYSENGKDYFWEFVPLVLKKDNYKVEIRQCNKEDIMEIDNYYELKMLDSSYK